MDPAALAGPPVPDAPMPDAPPAAPMPEASAAGLAAAPAAVATAAGEAAPLAVTLPSLEVLSAVDPTTKMPAWCDRLDKIEWNKVVELHTGRDYTARKLAKRKLYEMLDQGLRARLAADSLHMSDPSLWPPELPSIAQRIAKAAEKAASRPRRPRQPRPPRQPRETHEPREPRGPRQAKYAALAEDADGDEEADGYADFYDSPSPRQTKRVKRAPPPTTMSTVPVLEPEVEDEDEDMMLVAAEAGGQSGKERALPAPGEPAFLRSLQRLLDRNNGAYWQNEWRRAPYTRRPYEVIDDFRIGADVPEEYGKAIRRKMCTTVPDGRVQDVQAMAFDGHETIQSELILKQNPLVPGVDIEERDLWGMDCYTVRAVNETLRHVPALKERPDREFFIEHWLMPAVNGLNDEGWDMMKAVEVLRARAQQEEKPSYVEAAKALSIAIQNLDERKTLSMREAEAVARMEDAAPPSPAEMRTHFRLHPKGVGVVCIRKEGIEPNTVVAPYIGELYPPWRWFERQDAIKKRNPLAELPDFYNICLECPKQDEHGYDTLFVEAAYKTTIASRLSHSCTPNCQTVVVVKNGKLCIWMVTTKRVEYGEEMCWDYACVTESEREFRAAICLCSTPFCRGSFLSYANSHSFMDVMSRDHDFLDRNALVLRAVMEDITEEDRKRIERAKGGLFGRSVLTHVDGTTESPKWLIKWAALVMEFVDQETQLLPQALLARGAAFGYNESNVAVEAAGVRETRIQNLAITIDKVKYFLAQQKSEENKVAPPLVLLTDDEIKEHLWNGQSSIARRVLDAAQPSICPSSKKARDIPIGSAGVQEELVKRKAAEAASVAVAAAVATEKATAANGASPPPKKVAAAAALQAEAEAAAAAVAEAEAAAVAAGAGAGGEGEGGHATAPLRTDAVASSSNAADGAGDRFTSIDKYAVGRTALKEFETMLKTPCATADEAREKLTLLSKKLRALGPQHAAGADVAALNAATVYFFTVAKYDGFISPEVILEQEIIENTSRSDKKGLDKALAKRYQINFIWGQLSAWFKQTVYDPSASLSAERRGTLSLPDPESAYGSGTTMRYVGRERAELMQNLRLYPEKYWPTSTMWSFRNPDKVYGSPMLDDAMFAGRGEANRLTDLLDELVAVAPVRNTQRQAKPKAASQRRGGRGGGAAEKAAAAAAAAALDASAAAAAAAANAAPTPAPAPAP
mmetsp:Transcript_26094/g.85738  ORF Transcript_26094/g.85738 Transcript_26094/m.85738 type:complete len:1200 (+) Transcript_26094:70-3669(+)